MKYLKWLLMRNIVGEWIRHDLEMSVYVLEGTSYDVKKMKEDYIRITKELLKEYEISFPENKESGKKVLWENSFDGNTTTTTKGEQVGEVFTSNSPQTNKIKIGEAEIYFDDSRSPVIVG